MRVFVLYSWEDYENDIIFGVFSSRGNAEAAKALLAPDGNYRGFDIDEYEMDTLEGGHEY